MKLDYGRNGNSTSKIRDSRNMAGNSNRISPISTDMGLNSPTVPMTMHYIKDIAPHNITDGDIILPSGPLPQPR